MDRLVLAGIMNGVLATLLALVAVAATRAWRNPYFARTAWLAVLLKLVTPPLLFVPVDVAWLAPSPGPVPASVDFAAQPAKLEAEQPAIPLRFNETVADAEPLAGGASRAGAIVEKPSATASFLSSLILQLRSHEWVWMFGAVWIAGVFFLGVVAATRIWQFQRLLARSPLAAPVVADRAVAIAGRIGLRAMPRVVVVVGRMAPLAWALGRRATVIVPAALAESFDRDALDAVLAHELTHLRRRDNWVRWLELAATTLYWWCPTAWLARRRVHEAEEQCCDADVLRVFPALRRAYGIALLETLDLLAGDPSMAPGASGWGTRRSLRRRFEQIAAEPAVAPLRAWGRGGCWTAIALVCLLAPTAASSEEPKVERANAPTTSEPTAAATDNQAETISFEIEEESLPCTITLSNGAIINGMLIDQDGERLVVLSDEKRDAGDKSPGTHDPPALVRKTASLKVWDLGIDECVRLMVQNHPTFCNSEFTNDDGWLTLSWRDETRHSLLEIQRFGEDQVRDVSDCYWELYFAYRDVESRRDGLATALKTWRRVKERYSVGDGKVQANDEAQCRSQFFNFRQQVETATSNLFVVENRLRYLLGLAASDGRLIHPVTPPVLSERHIDWEAARAEAFAKRVDVRERAKRLEEHQRWQKAAEASVVASEDPSRKERIRETTARHCQLLTAREMAVLDDVKLSVSHQVGQAIRDLDLTYGTTQTNTNQQHAAVEDVAAVEAIYEAGRATLDLLLQSHQRESQAASAYHRSVADYQRALARVEYRKGTVLESMKFRVAQ